jgi:hypothetical protein
VKSLEGRAVVDAAHAFPAAGVRLVQDAQVPGHGRAPQPEPPAHSYGIDAPLPHGSAGTIRLMHVWPGVNAEEWGLGAQPSGRTVAGITL